MVAMTIKKRQVLDKLLCPKMDIKIFFLIRQQEDRTKKRNDKSLIINTLRTPSFVIPLRFERKTHALEEFSQKDS